MGAIGKNVDWGPEGIQSQSRTGRQLIHQESTRAQGQHEELASSWPGS